VDAVKPSSAMAAIALVLSLALVAAACTGATDDDTSTNSDSTTGSSAGGGGSDTSSQTSVPEVTFDEAVGPASTLTVRPGPYQVTLDSRPADVPDGSTIEAYNSAGDLVGSGNLVGGTAVVKALPPGPIELVTVNDSGEEVRTTVEVGGETAPDPSIYDGVELREGFGYLPVRDGTTLSTFVTLPGPADEGPYPILVEYSGYSPSAPAGSGDDIYRTLLPLLGFGLVQVNVRGTGCSGGAFDTFERIQAHDGYDVIETVARQPWAAKVGMFGVSYPGIMQLHVASTNPPSLAAVAPLSITERLDTVIYPGGLYNNGFGERWTALLAEAAQPSGLPWIATRVSDGDATCTDNQRLRVHNADLVGTIQNGEFLSTLLEERAALTYASAIEAPTFLAGAWQDEQTGGRFPEILDDLATVDRPFRAMLYNGTHIDSVSPELLVRLLEFYNLYVAERPTAITEPTRLLIETAMASIYGAQVELPAGRYDDLSVDQARAAFEAEPQIEVLFELGSGPPNLLQPGFRAGFDEWPIPSTVATPLYLTGEGSNGTLSTAQPSSDQVFSYVTDPVESQAVTVADIGSLWTSEPEWIWERSAPESALTFTSEPVTENTVLVGGASADLWVSMPFDDDAGIEVTLSEVAADGSETYIQTGWLRLALRNLADDATELVPAISTDPAGFAPLTPGGPPVLARIEIPPFGHAFRPGSRIRLTIDSPGGSRPSWQFIVYDRSSEIQVHSTPDQPSRLLLPVVSVPDGTVPDAAPACGSLRAQPCRAG
jgi:predicted acyl esterase